jgi:hypothetical protein
LSFFVDVSALVTIIDHLKVYIDGVADPKKLLGTSIVLISNLASLATIEPEFVAAISVVLKDQNIRLTVMSASPFRKINNKN